MQQLWFPRWPVHRGVAVRLHHWHLELVSSPLGRPPRRSDVTQLPHLGKRLDPLTRRESNMINRLRKTAVINQLFLPLAEQLRIIGERIL